MDTKQLYVLGILAVILLLLASVIAQFIPVTVRAPDITNFAECAAAGHPVMESYPRQCAANNVVYVEEVTPPSIETTPVSDGIEFNGCVVAGCSMQLCVTAEEAANTMTTCEFRAEYACYREAVCEPQADDTCGWTMTPALQQCLANPPSADENLQLI